MKKIFLLISGSLSVLMFNSLAIAANNSSSICRKGLFHETVYIEGKYQSLCCKVSFTPAGLPLTVYDCELPLSR
jgi:hypothetical protein